MASRMNASLRVRVMQEGDLPFADSLRAVAGWNQTLDDWRRFLAMQPKGCFLAELDGAQAGTATTVVYGSGLAWVGMLLVHPDFRRRGVGRALLLRCIEHLQDLKVKCIKLDATPEGRLVYEKLGFKEGWSLRRWEASLSAGVSESGNCSLRAWDEADLSQLNSLDAQAFGTSRSGLISALARQSRCALTCERAGEGAIGYGFLREGSRASYLGPVIATLPRDGISIVEAILARAGGTRVFWDIPDLNAAAVDWAASHDFTVQRSLTRMWLGENCCAGNPRQQFAIAGPEMG
ncbi:MAG TPA: GNAT family N-acetyltransferase [Verrucomicrobiae bacterium]|jgi:ribosomal protein S18 acetylase RimI-like enzyme|nr:GNAT family N-acetyltransferase [Verrucomicrobiae bacterium]